MPEPGRGGGEEVTEFVVFLPLLVCSPELHNPQKSAHLHAQAQLFGEFAGEDRLHPLTGFDVAARQKGMAKATCLGHQHMPGVLNDSAGEQMSLHG